MTSEHGLGVAMATDATGTPRPCSVHKGERASVSPFARALVDRGHVWRGKQPHLTDVASGWQLIILHLQLASHTTDEWFITLRHFPFIITHKGVLPSQIARSHDAILSSCISFIAERVGYPEVVTSPILLNNDGPGDSGMFPPPELCRMFAQIVAQAAVLQ